jgi:hypothetical protein
MSLLLALLVTPVAYSILDDANRLFRRLFHWRPVQEQIPESLEMPPQSSHSLAP